MDLILPLQPFVLRQITERVEQNHDAWADSRRKLSAVTANLSDSCNLHRIYRPKTRHWMSGGMMPQRGYG